MAFGSHQLHAAHLQCVHGGLFPFTFPALAAADTQQRRFFLLLPSRKSDLRAIKRAKSTLRLPSPLFIPLSFLSPAEAFRRPPSFFFALFRNPPRFGLDMGKILPSVLRFWSHSTMRYPDDVNNRMHTLRRCTWLSVWDLLFESHPRTPLLSPRFRERERHTHTPPMTTSTAASDAKST